MSTNGDGKGQVQIYRINLRLRGRVVVHGELITLPNHVGNPCLNMDKLGKSVL